ncbi:hypothetical protein JXD38_12015 [candidate division WOR-3 bacterium]|nr:hypothetical protein [candidate division WOR-3 bacterium]
MKSHVSLMREADDLQRTALSLRDTFADEAGILHKSVQDWHNEANRFCAWYYRAVQLMADSGFAGLGKFQALCEGDRFSMLDFYTTLALGGEPEEGWRNKVYPRLSQMHFILGALPAAMRAKAEREARPRSSVSILDRLGDLSEI